MKRKSAYHPAPSRPGRGPYFNALKEGLNSGHVLLPGDNVAKFRAMREDLYETLQPRTRLEASCVETIAAADWRMSRSKAEQRAFKHHLGAVVSGDANATGYLCDPDAHRVHHRGADCTLEEERLDRFKARAVKMLAVLQKHRTQNLALGIATPLKDWRTLLAEGEPALDDDVLGTQPGTGAGNETPTEPATPGSEKRIRSFNRSRPAPAPRAFPKHWSHRQRQAALQHQATLQQQALERQAAPKRTGNPAAGA